MDSDDDVEESPKWNGIPGCLILINVLEDLSIISKAHEATCLLIKQYLRSSSSQMVGVSLYGTNTTESTFNTNNVVDIFPMDLPSLEGYKKLRDLDIECFGKASSLKLSEVLWHCSKAFKYCGKKLSSQTVFILTRLHNAPVDSDKQQTLKRVVDLVDFYTDIKIVNISPDKYPIDSFYKKFFIEVNKSKDFVFPQPLWDVDDIQNYLYQHSHRHVALAKLSFEIGNGFAIGVGLYSLLKKPTQSNHKTSKIDRRTNEVVDSATKIMKHTVECSEGVPQEVPILNSELLFYQEYGGERIEFTKQEKEKIDSPFGSQFMKLLGFKPARMLCKEKWFLKTGYFLYPNEKIIEGSTIAFKALHKACVETNTVALCILCSRKKARPTIVALAPCSNPLGLDVEIGFDVIHVPFVEHVREIPHLEDNSSEIAPDEAHKTLMKDIMRKLLFDYKADMFENPKLQTEYHAIEAKALQEENVDPFIDTTKRDPECYKDIKEDLFEELFGPFGMLSIKRASEKSMQPKSKKVKSENIDEEEVLKSIEDKTVKNFTVVQLKKILENKNVPVSQKLRKNDLETLVYQHFSS